MDLDTVAIMDASEFERGFQRVAAIVRENSYIPAERYVLVDAFDNEITLRSRDNTTQIKHTFPASVSNRMFFGLNVKEMMKRIKFLVGETIEIRQPREGQVSFHGGGVNMALEYLPVTNYPTDQTIEYKPILSCEAPTLGKALRLMAPGVGSGFDTGASMHMVISEKDIRLEAQFHGFGMSRAIVPLTSTTELQERTLLIPKTITELWANMYTGSSLTILQDRGENNAAFCWGNTSVSGTLMYGKWPDFDKLLNIPIVTEAVLPYEQLHGILSLISVNETTKEYGARALIRFTDESVYIESIGGTGTADADIPCQSKNGKNVIVGVNIKQVDAVIKNIGGKQIQIGINEYGHIRIQYPNEEKYIYVAMPITGTFKVEE